MVVGCVSWAVVMSLYEKRKKRERRLIAMHDREAVGRKWYDAGWSDGRKGALEL